MKKKNDKYKKFKVALGRFSAATRAYILMEYRDVYNDIFNSVKITREVRQLTTEYYLGGNTVPFTAGQVVDYVRSKYDFNKKD